MVKSSKIASPILYLRFADEYLDAVHTLAIAGENNAQATQTAPIYTLFGFAFEMLLKTCAQLWKGEIEEGHNLMALLDHLGGDLDVNLYEWTKGYVTDNRSVLSEAELEAVLLVDPNYGCPNGDFKHNLERLNRWTNSPFQSRYPKVALMKDARLDVVFLHHIGLKLHEFLMPQALE